MTQRAAGILPADVPATRHIHLTETHQKTKIRACKFNNETQNQIIMPIPVGSKAPDFTLKSKTPADVEVKLSNNLGKKNTVLLFFSW